MTSSIDNLFEVLAILCDENNATVTIKCSLLGGVVSGASAMLGGLIGGRRGLTIGGIIGSLLAAGLTDSFKPLSQVLKNMDPVKREELVQKLERAFQDINIWGILAIIAAITGAKTEAKELALKEVKAFVTQYLGMECNYI